MNDEEMQKALRLMEMYKSQLDTMERQSEMVQMTMEEYTRSKLTLESIKTMKKGDDILMPIGGDVMVFGTVDNPKKAIVNVGKDVSLEMTMPQAIKKMDERLEEAQKAQESIRKSMEELAHRIQEISTELRNAGQ